VGDVADLRFNAARTVVDPIVVVTKTVLIVVSSVVATEMLVKTSQLLHAARLLTVDLRDGGILHNSRGD